MHASPRSCAGGRRLHEPRRGPILQRLPLALLAGYTARMGITLGWFAAAASEGPSALVEEALRSVARELGGEQTPAWAFAERHGAWTSVILADDGAASVNAWSQATSKHLQRTVAFWVFEGAWSYEVHESGTCIGGMDAHSGPIPRLHGEREDVARALGIGADVLLRYQRACAKEDQRAFPDDEHAASDEWAHLDFARRAGIAHPEVDADRRVFFNEADRPRFKKDRKRPPPSLEPGARAIHAHFGLVTIVDPDPHGSIGFTTPRLPGEVRFAGAFRSLMTRDEAREVVGVLRAPPPSERLARRERRRQTADAVESAAPTALARALAELVAARRAGVLRDPYEHSQLDALAESLVSELAVVLAGEPSELASLLETLVP